MVPGVRRRWPGQRVSHADLTCTRALHHPRQWLTSSPFRSPCSAYIFRPSQQFANPLTTSDNPVKILGSFSGPLVSEVWQQITPWIVMKTALYANNPAAIEFTYTVGPIPVDDKVGKEVILRFNASSIASEGVWYTDSNGREFQERKRNSRPTWKWSPTQPVRAQHTRSVFAPLPRPRCSTAHL